MPISSSTTATWIGLLAVAGCCFLLAPGSAKGISAVDFALSPSDSVARKEAQVTSLEHTAWRVDDGAYTVFWVFEGQSLRSIVTGPDGAARLDRGSYSWDGSRLTWSMEYSSCPGFPLDKVAYTATADAGMQHLTIVSDDVAASFARIDVRDIKATGFGCTGGE